MYYPNFSSFPIDAILFYRSLKKKHPKEYRQIAFYMSKLQDKVEELEIIMLRFDKEYKELYKMKQKFLANEDYESDYDLIQLHVLLSIDLKTFLIFSRIVLDHIPYLFKTLYKKYITKNIPSTIDYAKHTEWILKNSKEVDPDYYKIIKDFNKLFQKTIREPRNELIVHPKYKHLSFDFSFEPISQYEIKIITNEKHSQLKIVNNFYHKLPPEIYEEIIALIQNIVNLFVDKMGHY